MLVSRGICEDKEKKLKGLQMEHQGCAEKLRASQELTTNYMKSANVMQRKLDDFALKVQGIEQKVVDEAHKTVYETIMKTRVEIMLEYHRGERSTWDVAETVRIYNDTYHDDAFPVYGLDGDDIGQDSPKDNAPGDEP